MRIRRQTLRIPNLYLHHKFLQHSKPSNTMASENKKRKQKNAYTEASMKEKRTKLKRVLYYNPANRQQNKKISNFIF